MSIYSLKILLETAYRQLLSTVLANRDLQQDVELTMPFGVLTVNKSCTYATLKVKDTYLLPNQKYDFVAYRISITGIIHEHHMQLSAKQVQGSRIPVFTDTFIPLPYTLWVRHNVGTFRSKFKHSRLFDMEHVFNDVDELHRWIRTIYDPKEDAFIEDDTETLHEDAKVYQLQRVLHITKYCKDTPQTHVG